jgi:hypothetical protein
MSIISGHLYHPSPPSISAELRQLKAMNAQELCGFPQINFFIQIRANHNEPSQLGLSM